ncbi:MAG: CorA family divalent cation transporter [Cyanobacteria bacterium P01_G01_bin.39]
MSKKFELQDYHGLVCGFLLDSQAPAQPLSWSEVNQIFDTKDNNDHIVWLHFSLIDSRVKNWIGNCQRIPELARELLLESNPHIQLEILNNSFFCVLGDLYYDFDADPESLGLIRIYVSSNCMISVREKPLKAIDKLRLSLLQKPKIVKSPMELMVDLIEISTDIFDSTVIDLREAVEDMEDLVLKGNFSLNRLELSRMRRLVARLRRHLNASHYALRNHLVAHFPSWCDHTEEVELRRHLEQLSAVAQELELVQERARLVQEEMTNKLQETLNRNLYLLSLVTTIFLPITLITGIFGMNVGGIPWTNTSLGFLWCTLLMVITLSGVFIILKRQKLFY